MNFIITNVKNVYSKYYQYPENEDMFDGRLSFADYLVNADDKVIMLHKRIQGEPAESIILAPQLQVRASSSLLRRTD